MPGKPAMSIGASAWLTILVGSGKLAGKNIVKPNGKPTVTGRISSLIPV